MGSVLSVCEAPACPNFDYFNSKEDKLDKIINLLEQKYNYHSFDLILNNESSCCNQNENISSDLIMGGESSNLDEQKWDRVKNEILEFMTDSEMDAIYIDTISHAKDPKEVMLQWNCHNFGLNLFFGVICHKLNIAYPHTFNIKFIDPNNKQLNYVINGKKWNDVRSEILEYLRHKLSCKYYVKMFENMTSEKDICLYWDPDYYIVTKCPYEEFNEPIVEIVKILEKNYPDQFIKENLSFNNYFFKHNNYEGDNWTGIKNFILYNLSILGISDIYLDNFDTFGSVESFNFVIDVSLQVNLMSYKTIKHILKDTYESKFKIINYGGFNRHIEYKEYS